MGLEEIEGKKYIKDIFRGKKIMVPEYQRAYSWDSPNYNQNKETQTDVFLQDLENYKNSQSESPYYFGHFLLQKESSEEYYVIDGQHVCGKIKMEEMAK